jgi:uncharacterized membrane protein YqiK
MSVLGWIIVLAVVLAVLIALAAWFFERASNETALVRTGLGGRRVVMDGGVLAIPYFHEIARVNMATLRLDVARGGAGALITRDRMRVDVGAEFYVSVAPTADAVARAAQTLGRRTFRPEELRGLIDGMMVDALRAVAARRTMDELHENRGQVVAEVRDQLKDVLARYGLELDSVSLTELDQTPLEALDERNAFNAEGMRKLAEVIAKSKKARAEIDSDAEVAVRRAGMETARRRLEIDLEEHRARLAQQQEVETLSAAQIAEVARARSDSERAAAEARIDMERRIQAAEIARDQAIEIAEQDRAIAVAARSMDESRAGAEADLVRAEAAKAAGAVETAKAVAEAERRREVDLIAARALAEAAIAEAEAARARAAANKAAGLDAAEALTARITAENLRSDAAMALETERARLEAMPRILAEAVKPAEKINAINIHHLSGRESAPANQALDSILDMALHVPALKKIGERIGVEIGADLTKDDGEAG